MKEYYDFLIAIKNGDERMVKFVAIVGVDPDGGPSATEITYHDNTPSSVINWVCETPNCVADCDPANTSCIEYCHAHAGPRYIQLAEMFGVKNGIVDTICQEYFDETLARIGEFIACPRRFNLSEKILDPGLANIIINGEPIPRYSCSGSSQENIELCSGPGASCSAGDCIETWSFLPPTDPLDPLAPGGKIEFADHYDPCKLITAGEIFIELIYVTE